MRAFGLGAALVVAGATAHLRDARACGGVFVAQSESFTVVTEHRIAVALARDRTVVWDQIRYAGNPREFAWVAPVRPGATLELSSDAWFDALEASTQPVVFAPPEFGTAAGCALAGCNSDEPTSERGAVQVVRSSLVGPYETVTIRANDPAGVGGWLRDRGFAVPDAVAPTLAAYASEGYDFIALRLRPECGTGAMRPVRIVTPVADATIPLRLMAAGAGSREVAVTLWVIGEARYAPVNFPTTTLQYSKLVWERSNNRSNYDSLADEAMSENAGRSWITEYADFPPLQSSVPLREQRTVTPTLFDTYSPLCAGGTPKGVTVGTAKPNGGSPCPSIADAGVADGGPRDAQADAPSDAGAPDADADGGADAGVDAGVDAAAEAGVADAGKADARAPEAGVPGPPLPAACPNPDDLSLALRGQTPGKVFLTRMRASLVFSGVPVQDLRLAVAAEQTVISNSVQTVAYSDEARRDQPDRSAACESHRRRGGSLEAGLVALVLACALGLRRRRR